MWPYEAIKHSAKAWMSTASLFDLESSSAALYVPLWLNWTQILTVVFKFIKRCALHSRSFALMVRELRVCVQADSCKHSYRHRQNHLPLPSPSNSSIVFSVMTKVLWGYSFKLSRADYRSGACCSGIMFNVCSNPWINRNEHVHARQSNEISKCVGSLCVIL